MANWHRTRLLLFKPLPLRYELRLDLAAILLATGESGRLIYRPV